MPYSSLESLKKSNKKAAKALENYTPAQRKAFLKILNGALKQYPDDEGKAFATAYSKAKLVKESFNEFYKTIMESLEDENIDQLADEVIAYREKQIIGEIDEVSMKSLAMLTAALTLVIGGMDEAEAAQKTGANKFTVKKLANNQKVKVRMVQLDELQVVARTLYDEARGESRAGLEAVASVIMNRAENSGISMKDVCLQHRQFSGWNDGKVEKGEGDKWDECVKLTHDMQSGVFKPKNNYTHFLNPKAVKTLPGWAYNKDGNKKSGLRKMVSIGNHKFAKIN